MPGAHRRRVGQRRRPGRARRGHDQFGGLPGRAIGRDSRRRAPRVRGRPRRRSGLPHQRDHRQRHHGPRRARRRSADGPGAGRRRQRAGRRRPVALQPAGLAGGADRRAAIHPPAGSGRRLRGSCRDRFHQRQRRRRRARPTRLRRRPRSGQPRRARPRLLDLRHR